MTDLAFIVDTSDAALPAGRASSSVSPASAGEGSFSGVLGERLQSDLVKQSQGGGSPPKLAASDTNVVAENGVSEPVDGKPLPVLASAEQLLPDEAPVVEPLTTNVVADAALLEAVKQSVPQTVITPVVPVVPVVAGSAKTEQASAANLSQLTNAAGGLPANLTNGLTSPLAKPLVKAPAASSANTAAADVQLPAASLAKQLASTSLNGLPVEKQNVHADTARTNTANITPSLLAQPVSESAQRALVLAMNDAGLGKQGALNRTGQSEASLVALARQSGLSPLSNGLTTAMQATAATTNAVSNNAHEAITRLALQQGTTSSVTTPLSINTAATDVSGVLPVGQSVSPALGSGFMPTMPVSTPVGQAGWANELGQRVSWLAQGQLREAQLQLHPRSLGPVEVRIAYGTEQQLNVSFTAANPVAREALDAALPRLREMFEQQGLDLADANISQHSFSEQGHPENEEGDANSNSEHWSAETENLTEQAVLANSVMMGDGMLDAYA